MTDPKNSPVEQLCYTWSESGLSSLSAGARIRAASPELLEIRSERVRSMDRYMRYVLPQGTDPYAITPAMAPVCLAFIRTDWQNEYIVVRKEYVGEDGFGRKGNFFVHLFALGPNFDTDSFSAENAIWLWGSDLWKTSEQQLEAEFEQQGLGRRNVKMEGEGLAQLRDHQGLHPNSSLVRQYLPFIIEAYLTRKERQPLYIAASADAMDVIINLIAGLTFALPYALMQNLTFSTYEPDITKAKTEIVGTSWINIPGKEVSPHVFSQQFYAQNLALNYSTGQMSELTGHPLVLNDPLIRKYAYDVTDWLVSGNLTDFYRLREQIEKSCEVETSQERVMDAKAWLVYHYGKTLIKEEDLSTKSIEMSLSYPVERIVILNGTKTRARIIKLALQQTDWWKVSLQPLLLQLRKEAMKELANGPSNRKGGASSGVAQGQQKLSMQPRQGKYGRSAIWADTEQELMPLSKALLLLAQNACDKLLPTMKKTSASKLAGVLSNLETFLEIVESCLVPQEVVGVWKFLLNKIITTEEAWTFFVSQWEAQSLLLARWRDAFTVGSQEERDVLILLKVPWDCLGSFLKRRLSDGHWLWTMAVLHQLAQDLPYPLLPQTVQGLGQNYSAQINELLEQCLQAEDLAFLSDVNAIVLRLYNMGYATYVPPQQQRQFVEAGERLLERLIAVGLWPQAGKLLLILLPQDFHVRDRYQRLVENFLPQLFKGAQQDVKLGFKLFDKLVNAGFPKSNLVRLLLDSPASQADLEEVLRRVYQTPEALSLFFVKDGAKYLANPKQRQVMLKLFQKLLLLDGKMARLFVLLDTFAQLNPAEIESDTSTAIKEANLEDFQLVEVLQKHGATYLRSYQSPLTLANYVVSVFKWLAEQKYRDTKVLLFSLFTPSASAQHLETLVRAALPLMTLEDRKMFFNRYGTDQNYLLFFQGSQFALPEFAQLVDRNALSSAEKMKVVLMWLKPSQNIPSLIQPSYTQAVLQFVTNASEQIEFLEAYGEKYAGHYQYLPVIVTFIETYVANITSGNFEQLPFLTTLCNNNSLFPLQPKTKQLVANWKIVKDYLATSDVTEQRMHMLTEALVTLVRLPNGDALVSRLMPNFVYAIRSSHDIEVVVHYISQIPNVSAIQLLYDLTEQCEQTRIRQNPNALFPYLEYILTTSYGMNNAPYSINSEGAEAYFLIRIMETLFQPINSTDLPLWQGINAYLLKTAQQKQWPETALRRWQSYLGGLALPLTTSNAGGDRLTSDASTTGEGTQSTIDRPATVASRKPKFPPQLSSLTQRFKIWPSKKHPEDQQQQPAQQAVQSQPPFAPTPGSSGPLHSTPSPNFVGGSPSGPYPNQYPDEQESERGMERSQLPLYLSEQRSSQEPKPLLLPGVPDDQAQNQQHQEKPPKTQNWRI